MNLQRTIKREIDCRGVGLHSGRKINMKILPAGIEEGIVFIRRDMPGHNMVKARFENVSNTTLATTIGMNGASVSTIEHLMSAFAGMGVDNAIVEIDGPEVPIMDGSAFPFVSLLKDVGTRLQEKDKKILVINNVVSVSDDSGTAMLLPFPEFKITYKIDFKHPLIGQQFYSITISAITYETEISAARTFGFLKDVEYLQAKGLALGGSLKNVVVLNDKGIINKEGLRYADEFVKHKILDAIGDLALTGMPIKGHFIAYKSGHKLNYLLLKELFAHEENYAVISRYHEDENTDKGHSSLMGKPSFKVLNAVNA
jgi:UDP-3-O-[3-hydroxymyristoyl] N-acetylglucosamine deacetylase